MIDYSVVNVNRLPDGTEERRWDDKTNYTKTYYVDCNHPMATDDGMGTKDIPFLSINHAAQILQPSERVIISGGVYRESVHPKNGGNSEEEMISYEAAEGEEVIIMGSVIVKEGWKVSEGWKLEKHKCTSKINIWQVKLEGVDFEGYNPFGMANVLQDRQWLFHKKINMNPFFQRRGLVFIDGKPLRQVELYSELTESEGLFWIEHNGMTLHIRFPADTNPGMCKIEVTIKEQVFSPKEPNLGYIKVKGLKMLHAANGFPVPQRGMLSTYRGHHWIIDNNTIDWANSVGIDAGNECWNAYIDDTTELGRHIIRGNVVSNCGICGLAAFIAPDLIVEDNIFDNCGWHDAEHMYESAGVKFHVAKNLMFRKNIIRHIKHATGLWLDCTNENCRITGNLFYDITSRAAAIQLECTHEANLVDNNVIYGVKAQYNLEGVYGMGGHGIEADGSDKIIMIQNIIANCENAGFFADTVAERIVDGRGGTARNHSLYKNIFHNCGRAAIEFANEHNYSEGNIYSSMPKGFLRIMTPNPKEILDLSAWREFHKWDIEGTIIELSLVVGYDGNIEISKVGEIEADRFNSEKVYNKSKIHQSYFTVCNKELFNELENDGLVRRLLNVY